MNELTEAVVAAAVETVASWEAYVAAGRTPETAVAHAGKIGQLRTALANLEEDGDEDPAV
jgi:hypothetical protein